MLFVYLFFLIIKQLLKLAEDDSFRLEKALNKMMFTTISLKMLILRLTLT